MESNSREGIVITGAAGMLGWNLVRNLADDPLFAEYRKTIGRIRCVDLVEPPIKTLKNESKIEIDFFKGNVTNPSEMKEATKGDFSCIFHLAAFIAFSKYNETKVLNINYGGTQNLVEAALENNIPRFIYASSIEVARKGGFSHKADENSPIYGLTPYSKSKVASEKFLQSKLGTKTKNGTPFTFIILRPIGMYGEGDANLTKRLLGEAKKGNNFIRFGPAKDYLYVGNMNWAFLVANEKLKNNPSLSGEAFFIKDDTPEASDSHEFLAPYFRMHGYGVPKYTLPLWGAYLIGFLFDVIAFIMNLLGRPYEPLFSIAMIGVANANVEVTYTKASKLLGYKPVFSVQESERRSLEYWKDKSKF